MRDQTVCLSAPKRAFSLSAFSCALCPVPCALCPVEAVHPANIFFLCTRKELNPKPRPAPARPALQYTHQGLDRMFQQYFFLGETITSFTYLDPYLNGPLYNTYWNTKPDMAGGL